MKENKIILLSMPIGDLGDLTYKGRKLLEEREVFAVEDTRKFRDWCNRLSISTAQKKIVSFHDQSNSEQLNNILSFLEQGDLVVASDAGNPLLSDPAYPLVKEAIARGYEVETCSGVSAVTVALDLSGLPPYPFSFLGFFPRDNKGRKRWTEMMSSQTQTWILFESPHRIKECLEFLSINLPEAQVAVCRELTKTYQQVVRFKAAELTNFIDLIVVKGEFVVCVYTQGSEHSSHSDLMPLALQVLENKGKPKAVAKLLSSILGTPTKEVYSQISGQGKLKD